MRIIWINLIMIVEPAIKAFRVSFHSEEEETQTCEIFVVFSREIKQLRILWMIKTQQRQREKTKNRFNIFDINRLIMIMLIGKMMG